MYKFKYLGLLLPEDQGDSQLFSPASTDAESPGSFVSCILHPVDHLSPVEAGAGAQLGKMEKEVLLTVCLADVVKV